MLAMLFFSSLDNDDVGKGEHNEWVEGGEGGEGGEKESDNAADGDNAADDDDVIIDRDSGEGGDDEE
jgi:hypothetical protein